jgi:peptidoglycan/xylan/chitin deacetylase (PgdA/CDA1 family)
VTSSPSSTARAPKSTPTRYPLSRIEFLSDRRFLDKLRGGAGRLIQTRDVRMVNERPIVSFTFDGFAKSAALNAATALERRGAAGTFYISRCFCGATVDGVDHYDIDDLRRLVDNGHEIGCHTAGHLRAPSIGSAQLTADLDANAEFIREQFGDLRMTTFAFPFGDIDVRTKLRMQGRFAACRSTLPGVNASVADLGALRAEPLFSRSTDAAAVKSLIERSSRARSWLIFFTHDVEETPSPYGCTPTLFEHALESALTIGCQVLPVRNALGCIRFRTQPRRRNSGATGDGARSL